MSPPRRASQIGLLGLIVAATMSIPAAWLSAATEPAAPGAAGTWELRAPTGLPRAETSYTRIGARFYLAGGGTAHQVYLARRDAWRDLAPFPVGIDHSPAAAFGGRVYYLGGLVPDSVPEWPHFKEVFIYDPETDEFTEGAPMREERGRGAGTAVEYQGKIYLAGGQRDGNAVPWFDVYDPQANTWRRLPDMPRARHHHFAGVVDGKLYVIGGRPGNLGDTDVYDFATGEWATGLAALPTLRSGGASAVVGGRILTIGGEGRVDDVPQVFDTVEAYVVGRDRWRTLTPMPTARHGIDAVVWEGGVFVAAGGAAPKNVQSTDVHEVFFPSA